MNKIKTTPMRVRPYAPTFLKDINDPLKDPMAQKDEDREPYAILKYKNISIEIDYTLLQFLNLDVKSDLYFRTKCVFSASKRQIVEEMHSDMDGKLSYMHRDNGHPHFEDIMRNHLHESNIDKVQYGKNKSI